MVAMYRIFGREIGSHYLAMGVLASTFAGVSFAMGGSKVQKTQGPPLNASSPDEEKFIQDFLKNVESDGKKEPAKH
ncbi:ATP synthase subunit K, mitochondrial [Phlyctema vagabunda]|uniref:ATP synthase subunit K, mitochondrial n=1 Tax=Phlyctema vagabunda TaxID=108571 RepID=A0ABR4PVA2_9HELO